MKILRFELSRSKMISSIISLSALLGSIAVECKAEQATGKVGNCKHSYYVVFTADGQRSCGDIAADPNATVIGKAGSVFRTSPGGVVAVQGKMLFTTSRNTLTIGARDGARTLLGEKTQGLVEVSAGSTEVRLLDNSNLNNDGQNRMKVVNAEFAPSRGSCNDEPLRMIASEGTLFSAENKKLRVFRGSLLIDAPAAATIATAAGDLRFSDRSRLSVRIFNNSVCIENCSIPNSLDFSVKGTTIHLNPGGSCIVSNGKPTPSLVPLDGVVRRNFAARFDGRLTAITSEFHPLSLFRSNVDFFNCVKHPITRSEERIANELLKGTAALTIVTGKRGAYCLRPQNMPVFRLGTFADPFAQQPLLSMVPSAD